MRKFFVLYDPSTSLMYIIISYVYIFLINIKRYRNHHIITFINVHSFTSCPINMFINAMLHLFVYNFFQVSTAHWA